MKKLPIIGVMGALTDKLENLSIPLGVLLGKKNVNLLTGGGGGSLEAVAKSFCAVPTRKGISIGIIPGGAKPYDSETGKGYPNPYVEIPILTHLPKLGADGKDPQSRNHINALTPSGLIILPGGPGTVSEIELALSYQTPVLIYKGAEDTFAYNHPTTGEMKVTKDITDFLPSSVQCTDSLREVANFIDSIISKHAGVDKGRY